MGELGWAWHSSRKMNLSKNQQALPSLEIKLLMKLAFQNYREHGMACAQVCYELHCGVCDHLRRNVFVQKFQYYRWYLFSYVYHLAVVITITVKCHLLFVALCINHKYLIGQVRSGQVKYIKYDIHSERQFQVAWWCSLFSADFKAAFTLTRVQDYKSR